MINGVTNLANRTLEKLVSYRSLQDGLKSRQVRSASCFWFNLKNRRLVSETGWLLHPQAWSVPIHGLESFQIITTNPIIHLFSRSSQWSTISCHPKHGLASCMWDNELHLVYKVSNVHISIESRSQAFLFYYSNSQYLLSLLLYIFTSRQVRLIFYSILSRPVLSFS